MNFLLDVVGWFGIFWKQMNVHTPNINRHKMATIYIKCDSCFFMNCVSNAKRIIVMYVITVRGYCNMIPESLILST